MSHNSTTNTASTTSFIVSSNESIDTRYSLPTSLLNESNNSKTTMTASESLQNNQYFVLMNPVNNMLHNQHIRIHPTTNPPPPPPPPPPPEQMYGESGPIHTGNNNNYGVPNGIHQLQLNQSSLNVNDSRENPDSPQTLYTTFSNQDNLQLQNNIHSTIVPQGYIPNDDVNQTCFKTDIASDLEINTLNVRQNGFLDANVNKDNFNLSNNSTNQNSYSPKSHNQVNSFQLNRQSNSNQRTSISSLESAASNSLMPINVKGMLLHGVSNDEVMRAWLNSIKCEEYLPNFMNNGYDMPLLTRMTPQDLAAIGCTNPTLRKKLLLEIKKLNIEDDIPNTRPHSLEKWLELLKMGGYLSRLCGEGYNTIDKVCDLAWEDLEDIGIVKLGHQKRLLLGIERIKKFDKQQEEQQNDHAIYDVHPNHRISLNQYSDNRISTLNRSTMRTGFHQTRSGSNLDHRGLPVATVMPALKHVTNSLANMDISHQVINSAEGTKNLISGNNNQIYSTYHPEQSLKMSDLSSTIKRNPPPLPPVRTNSLKMPMETMTPQSNSIYGNNYGILPNGTSSTGSTSFLRTPKLGTLTATTNKMLTSGGHIQPANGHPTTIRSIMPIREAPPPPLPNQPPPSLNGKFNESSLTVNSFNSNPSQETRSDVISPSLIGHQLASADEFPPPPPPQ